MAKDHVFDIDLEEWELIPEDHSLCFNHGSSGAGKRSFTGKDPCFRSKVVAGAAAEFDSPIFFDEDDDPKDIIVVKPAAASVDGAATDRTFYLARQEYKDIGVVPPAPAQTTEAPPLKKTEENEFADLKMKVVDCASFVPMAINTTTQMELQAVDQKKPSLSEEEEEEEEDPKEEVVVKEAGEREGHRPPEQIKSCWDGIGISIWGWRFVAIGTVAAAATICTIVVLGGRQRARNQNQNQNLQLQVYPGDEGAASKLNQAMAAAKGGGGGVAPFVARASVSSGGYFDWL